MEIKEITISMTRQITQFHPYVVSLTATIKPGEDVAQCNNSLHEYVIRLLYKDKPVDRDLLIKQLITDTVKSSDEKHPNVPLVSKPPVMSNKVANQANVNSGELDDLPF